MKVNGQLTVGELKEQLEEIPDDTPIEVMASGAVGFAKSARQNGDAFVVSEHR